MLRDFDTQPHELHGYLCGREWPIDRVVQTLAAWSRGAGLPDGWVPCSTWFWEADGALQGVVNVRHRLTEQLRRHGGHIGYSVAPSYRRKRVATAMLAGALAECRRLGIDRALLTVDADNTPSWRAIERNGGVLEREAQGGSGERQRWYWVELT